MPPNVIDLDAARRRRLERELEPLVGCYDPDAITTFRATNNTTARPITETAILDAVRRIRRGDLGPDTWVDTRATHRETETDR